MNIFRNLTKSLARIRSGSAPVTAELQEWLRGEDDVEPGTKFLKPYAQSAWVYVAVSVLAESVAHIPFRISRGRGKGETLVESGPVYELFQKPHPLMSRTFFWQTLVSWDALRGEFFLALLDDRGQPVPMGSQHGRKPVQMIPLHPDHFTHIVEGHDLIGWRYAGQRVETPVESQVFLPEEIIHWRNFNPYQFWRGMSPLSVAMLSASTDFAAEQFMKGLVVNNGDAGLIITTEEMLDAEQRQQLISTLNDRKRRAGTADRPLFLWGKTKVEKPVISSADLQFLECRKLNRQEIGAIFKVPESMMGFAGQKSALSAGSAIEQDRLTFIENTVSGICRRLEAAMEPLIKSFDPSLFGWFDMDSLPIMQAARRERMLTAEKAFGMGVPFNEINQIYDLGFESLPWGNKGYVPNGVREVGEVVPKKPHKTEATIEPVTRLLELIESDAEMGAPAATTNRGLGKLKRFLFEQRGRALEALEKSCVGESAPKCENLLELEAENELMLVRMKSVLETCPGCEGILRHFNKATLDSLHASLGLGVIAREGFPALSARVKSVFQETADLAEQVRF